MESIDNFFSESGFVMAMENTITPSSPTSGGYFFTFFVSHQKGSFSSKCAGLPGEDEE
jgi:hypothetical protein